MYTSIYTHKQVKPFGYRDHKAQTMPNYPKLIHVAKVTSAYFMNCKFKYTEMASISR